MVVEWHTLSLRGKQWVPWGQMSGWSKVIAASMRTRSSHDPPAAHNGKPARMTNDAASVKPQHSQTCAVLAHLDLSLSESAL
jgi:hypothetical protein